jgi:hypothetical protein
MKTRNFLTLDDFLSNLHRDGVTLIDYDGKKVPCIIINDQKYKEIKALSGEGVIIDTLLNIFYDEKDVFVDIQLTFTDQGKTEYFLVHANNLLVFFSSLEESLMLGLCSLESHDNVFFIQLPKKEKIEYALKIIKEHIS